MLRGTPESADVRQSEYRVRWRREGRQGTTHIFQTRAAAERKVRGILALEEVKDETKMAEMPPLAEPPTIEERPVGAWARSEHPAPVPTDADREGMRSYFGVDQYESGPF